MCLPLYVSFIDNLSNLFKQYLHIYEWNSLSVAIFLPQFLVQNKSNLVTDITSYSPYADLYFKFPHEGVYQNQNPK